MPVENNESWTRKKLSQLRLLCAAKKSTAAKNRRPDEDQVGNVISNIACNSLIYSRRRSDALLVTLRPMERGTKFLMQFSVRVKFTGKRQFPYRGADGMKQQSFQLGSVKMSVLISQILTENKMCSLVEWKVFFWLGEWPKIEINY